MRITQTLKVSKRLPIIIILLSMSLVGCSLFKPKHTAQQHESTSAQLSTPLGGSPNEVAVDSESNLATDSRYKDIWSRIRAGYGFPNVSDSKLRTHLQWYAKHQSLFNRFSQHAEPYLYYVVSEMEANNIPLELALIPVIESSYNPHAVSPSNTVGIWQFIPETGRNFGLKQNNLYNGRKDVVASTAAVIRYLKKLSAEFDNDWLVVVAAYNSGEGTVKRAIEINRRAGKPTDFWSLPLPNHTQAYIPRLMALAKVIGNPQAYNIELPAIPNKPYFAKVKVDKQINLSQAAKQASLNANELKTLNAGFNTWLTSPGGEHPILVPVADAAAFKKQLGSLPATSDSASTNTDISGNSNPTSNSSTAKKTGEKSNKDKRDYYTVKAGDSLSTIARSQKMSVKSLAKLNDLSTKSVLKPGQKLLILSQATP